MLALALGWQGRRWGQRLALSVCPSLSAGTSEGVGEAPSRLVTYPEYHTSLQIPRVDGEYDLKMPRDMAYVFSGAYVPLSCKIIEQVSPPAAGEHRTRPPEPRPPSGGSGGGLSTRGWGWQCSSCWSVLPAAELCPAPAARPRWA